MRTLLSVAIVVLFSGLDAGEIKLPFDLKCPTLIDCSHFVRGSEEYPCQAPDERATTVTVIGPPNANTPNAVFQTASPHLCFDARLRKAAPYTSGHLWATGWDPNDSGWGLFIWQNAASPVDRSMLVAWFTYKPDGTPMWYVFQPGGRLLRQPRPQAW